MNDEDFKLLKRKDIYEFLQGNGPDLITYNGKEYGMPYYTGTELHNMCVNFGLTETPCGSRWEYIAALIDFAIETNRAEEFLQYIFCEDRFENLRELGTLDEIDSVYKMIFPKAIEYINDLIKMSRHELQYSNGHFYINEIGKKVKIDTPKFDVYSLSYVQGLKERCNKDLSEGNYDSVVTKSRTLMEEVLVQILEDNEEDIVPKGDLIKLYNQVKTLYGMKQSKEYDARVNSLLGGLEKIVHAVAEMRNANSDAHGVGSKRINIRESEARLVMNASITFCEYMISDHKKKE